VIWIYTHRTMSNSFRGCWDWKAQKNTVIIRGRTSPRDIETKARYLMMEASIEKQFGELRAKNKVRALTEEESGTGIDRLPNGVYGFTYSPLAANFPLFKARDLRSYEAHKLPDGGAVLLGFVTEGELMQMEAGRESVTVHLFAEPMGEASRFVAVPTARVQSHTEHSQRSDKGLEMQLGPDVKS
jgi:hypothetical protein